MTETRYQVDRNGEILMVDSPMAGDVILVFPEEWDYDYDISDELGLVL